MDGASSFDQYRMSDGLWERMKLVLPNYNRSESGGRPRADLRRVADAIFYRMRTGCQWKTIPPSLAPGSTAHQYFQQWAAEGVFTLFAVLFIFVGAQFVGMGLLGEYIGRIYHDVRARPRYFVQSVVGRKEIQNENISEQLERVI